MMIHMHANSFLFIKYELVCKSVILIMIVSKKKPNRIIFLINSSG